MISVTFVAQHTKTKEKTTSTTVFFDEWSEEVSFLVTANRVRLEQVMNDCRIFAVIINEE